MARSLRIQVTRAKKPAVAQDPINDQGIAQVAYELFLRRGGVHGHDQEDWFEAQRIVRERQRAGNGR